MRRQNPTIRRMTSVCRVLTLGFDVLFLCEPGGSPPPGEVLVTDITDSGAGDTRRPKDGNPPIITF
ncbi:hypothetical protein HAT2_00663 [Candidatus Similichlamydia laticola]|uniref:Uncharacterized protein n=1 Tax=Candidatus Similichlamydia laticola TaxID=2170265 RepID=A0A369KHB2_9BACT|nr:hypothetical protein HAT2_00663 [Candidatus Similichlamydia laticola]